MKFRMNEKIAKPNGFISKISKKIRKPHVSAIILAGGSGSRMGLNGVTKQWIELDGIPVVARCAMQFEKSEYISEIIICSKNEELPLYNGFKEKYNLNKLKIVVKGGDTRQKSALNGFKNVNDKSKIVVIHDAARCLVTQEIIKNTILAAKKHGCSCAAVRAKDTVRLSEKGEFSDKTLKREEIWMAQTPQAFKTEIYRAAAYYAVSQDFEANDDASLAENAGFAVKLVEGSDENIKITSKTDLFIAQSILMVRNDGLN